MPSRIAARSRGPPRPTTRRASARARSGAAFRRSRSIARAAPASATKCADRVEPVRDRGRIGQRRGEPLRQQPRARRRHRAVDGGEQRAAPLAGERAHQFEIAARRLVDRERRAGGLAQRRRQRRALADLRALDIGDRRPPPPSARAARARRRPRWSRRRRTRQAAARRSRRRTRRGSAASPPAASAGTGQAR